MKTRILYIEDEKFLGKIVCDTLEKNGYDVKWVMDGAGVMPVVENFNPHLCVIDIMLPGIDGYTLARNIKGLHPDTPVIFLTAKSETGDVLKGFESGGTDYIKKPFSLEELIARIENQLKMVDGREDQKNELTEIGIGHFIFIPGKYELRKDNKIIRLSNRDTEVLSFLAANKNKVVERKSLLISVWGDDSFFNSRNLDVYIRKLRKYFSGDPSVEIKTLKGKGYILTDC